MIMVEIRGNDVVKVINGRMKLDVQIQVNGSAVAIDSKTNEKVVIIKDRFDNLKIKK